MSLQDYSETQFCEDTGKMTIGFGRVQCYVCHQPVKNGRQIIDSVGPRHAICPSTRRGLPNSSRHETGGKIYV